MHLIVYVSDYTGSLSTEGLKKELDNIVDVSKIKNPIVEITGVLYYHGGQFLQIIEGEKSDLEILMATLSKDQRHKNIERLVDDKVYNRRFQDWNMDYFNLEPGAGLDRDELKRITEVFKKIVEPRSDLLNRFYKAMVEAGSFRQ